MMSTHTTAEAHDSRLVTWPEALEAALAHGFTHVALRLIGVGNGRMIKHDGAFAAIREKLEGAAEVPGSFAQCTERVEPPNILTVIPEGPFAGTVLATYELVARPTVWDRLRREEA